jgi:anti-sigma28 factor (negative regulator of flagellin synthesis)
MGEMRQPLKKVASLDELRFKIERGRYEVKPDRVAEAMIRRWTIKFAPLDSRARPG